MKLTDKILHDSFCEHTANECGCEIRRELIEALETYLQAGHKEARREASIKAKAVIMKVQGYTMNRHSKTGVIVGEKFPGDGDLA